MSECGSGTANPDCDDVYDGKLEALVLGATVRFATGFSAEKAY